MRLQLNLNEYYTGLRISQVNHIFSMFVDMRIKIEQLKITLNKPEEKRGQLWQVAKDVYSISVLERVKNINSYIESLGKERPFVVGETLEETDFGAIITKYEYLMSEPD